MNDLPKNIEAEMAVIGSVLFDNGCLPDSLRPDDFSEAYHALIWTSASDLIRAGRTADPATLSDRLKVSPAFDQFGGIGYLFDLIDKAPALSLVGEYAATIQDASTRRKLIAYSAELAERAKDPTLPASDHIVSAERELSALAESGPAHTAWCRADEVTANAVRNARERGGGIELPTGLTELDRLTGGLRRGEMAIIAGRPAMGKAQPLHSKILRADGSWTTMGEVCVGDALASVDGAESIVTATHDRGERETYRVTLSDGRYTEACGDHLWRVVSRHWPAPRVVSTVELRRLLTAARHKNRLSVDLVSGDFGKSADLPVDPYVLGAILGDGSTVGGNRIGFTSADQEIVERISNRLPDGVEIKKAAGRYQYTIGRTAIGGCNPLIDRLRALGIMGLRSEFKSIPAQYLAASRDDRLALLRGLMDTDGWAEMLGAVRFCSTSLALARDVLYLVRSLGAVASIKSRISNCHANGVKTPGLRSYTVKIRHPHGEQFFTLARKANRAVRGRNAVVRLNVASVERCKVQAVRCITVSHPSSLYVTDDFIVTHNSSAGLTVAKSIASIGKGAAFFSMEMPRAALGLRMACDIAFDPDAPVYSGETTNPTYFKADRNDLDADQWRQLERAADRIAGWPLHFDPRPGLTVSAMEACARRLIRDWDRQGIEPGVIVVDHLTIARPDADRRGNKVAEVGDISRSLAEMAKRLDVPVVALCQLSRDVEKRDNKDRRPGLSDLRWSGEIEQDARLVMFLYRPEYYCRRPENEDDMDAMMEWRAKLDRVRKKLWWLVEKNNNGPTGEVETYCDIACSAIRDRRGM